MRIYFIIIFGTFLTFNLKAQTNNLIINKTDSIVRIEMHLSAFGVESDYYPTITALIDFNQDTCLCKRSYYNPQYKDSYYVLSSEEIQKTGKLLDIKDLEKIKKDYTTQLSD